MRSCVSVKQIRCCPAGQLTSNRPVFRLLSPSNFCLYHIRLFAGHGQFFSFSSRTSELYHLWPPPSPGHFPGRGNLAWMMRGEGSLVRPKKGFPSNHPIIAFQDHLRAGSPGFVQWKHAKALIGKFKVLRDSI